MEIDKDSAVAQVQCGELSLWHGDFKRASDYFEEARRLARREGEKGPIWTMVLMRGFGGETADHLVYYDTPVRKEACLDLFQAVVRLAENRGGEAQQFGRAALARMTGTPEDLEVVRRALNDLERFAVQHPVTKDRLALHALLEDWKHGPSSCTGSSPGKIGQKSDTAMKTLGKGRF
jgi:hypothetical protein